MSKSPSLRRIQADIRELALDPSDRYHAAPLEDDMFEWHFTIRGADGTDFEGGIYHGRILLPPQYPFKPPHIVFLTPSGRFDINTKVCLSFSAFHPEMWQPAWGIRLILEALISFLPTPADGAIGALDWTSKERKRLAVASQTFSCPRCAKIAQLIPQIQQNETTTTSTKHPNKFQKEIQQLKVMQVKEHEVKTLETDTETLPLEENHDALDDNQTTTKNLQQPTMNDDKMEEQLAPQLVTTQEEEEEVATLEEPRDDVLPTTDGPMDNTILPPPTNPQSLWRDELDIYWLTDPMLNGSIVLLSIVCLVLGQKCYEAILSLS